MDSVPAPATPSYGTEFAAKPQRVPAKMFDREGGVSRPESPIKPASSHTQAVPGGRLDPQNTME